ncbi:MAG: protein-export chaperone SecB [Nitrospinae bacterium]|nr:protein-export chaperone SecB [Nitrospinota bacterium]
MQHKNFYMSFVDFRILNISFSINKGFKGRKHLTINPQIALAHKYEKKEKTLMVRLKISLTKGEIPFIFEIESEGRFIFKEAPNKDIIKNASTINCPAIIFPYVRETVADITRRAGFPPLHLPPINFLELTKR